MSNTAKSISPDVVYHAATVTRLRREQLLGHNGVVLWFTGLSGAGKSTLAHAVEEELHNRNCLTYVLDGDNVRHGLCGDLGFSLEDRKENLRRISEICKLTADAGIITFTAFISPVQQDRQDAKALIGDDDFIEIYCKASIEVCEARDVKGLYKKAREGKISNFTGISSPYEEPESADLVVDTGANSLEECMNQVLGYLFRRGIFISARK
jgi:adenylylsulfate kinase